MSSNMSESEKKEIELIRSTFTRASDDIPPAVACLISVIRYYGGSYSVKQLIDWASIDKKKFVTLEGLIHAATQYGFKANVKILTLSQIEKTDRPRILFFQDQVGLIGFVVCYGIYENRFVVGEPTFALMQYFDWQMESMWIDGITLELHPQQVF